ncbi:MAG: NADH-quinone oxidoreductase subunit D [Firmicutes bacterium]|nr:NADH-quinone oxidoreductase subunit D [Bacillota bacterium]
MLVNIGPQHPSTHGVLQVIVELEGETVISAEPELGYLHRCFEKICEGWSYPQIIPLTDRLDYISAIFNEWVYCRAVESLMGLEIPERAEYLRVIMAELNRIGSHLIAVGTFGMDLGATTPFTWVFRVREDLLNIFELVTGARQMYNYLRIGGVKQDIPEEFPTLIEQFFAVLEEFLVNYETLLVKNPIFVARSKMVGVLTAEVGLAYAATGPFLRASGPRLDLRVSEPYSVYDRFKFEVPTGTNGDCYDRTVVRLAEMRESMKIIRQALAQMPAGEIRAKTPKVLKVPAGEVYTAVESPRGEVGVYLVSDGGTSPYRLKWRSPSFVNLSTLPELVKGTKLADFIAILGSIDIILGEVDR